MICNRDILASDCGMSYRHLFDVMKALRAWGIYDWTPGGIARRKNGIKKYANEYFVGILLAKELDQVGKHLAKLRDVPPRNIDGLELQLPDGEQNGPVDGEQSGIVDGEHTAYSASIKPQAKPLAFEPQLFELARRLSSVNGWSGPQIIRALTAAIEFQAKCMPGLSLEHVGGWLVNAYRTYRSSSGKFAVGPQKFFDEGRYQSSQTLKITPKPYNPAQAIIEGQMAETGMSREEITALYAPVRVVKQ